MIPLGNFHLVFFLFHLVYNFWLGKLKKVLMAVFVFKCRLKCENGQ